MKLSRRDFLKQLGRMSAGLSLLSFVELEAIDLTLKENSDETEDEFVYGGLDEIIRTGYHHGDPCIYCGTEHDNVPIGNCPNISNSITVDANGDKIGIYSGLDGIINTGYK